MGIILPGIECIHKSLNQSKEQTKEINEQMIRLISDLIIDPIDKKQFLIQEGKFC